MQVITKNITAKAKISYLSECLWGFINYRGQELKRKNSLDEQQELFNCSKDYQRES